MHRFIYFARITFIEASKNNNDDDDDDDENDDENDDDDIDCSL